MSEDLESRLAAWRESMQTAGIGPGPVRDELESHLRDAFSTRVQSGQDPAAAFTGALERLGPGRDIQQEFNTALGPRGRIKRLLGRRVELFPSEMRLCAWAAIPASVFGIYFAFLNAYANRIFFARKTLAAGHYASAIQLGLEYILILLISGISLLAAIRYLRRPAYTPARSLVLFWVASAWYIGTFVLKLVDALSRGGLASNGTPLMSSLSMWPRCLTIAIAMLSFHDWCKRLRKPRPIRD
jgi:hypothetical protein